MMFTELACDVGYAEWEKLSAGGLPHGQPGPVVLRSETLCLHFSRVESGLGK